MGIFEVLLMILTIDVLDAVGLVIALICAIVLFGCILVIYFKA